MDESRMTGRKKLEAQLIDRAMKDATFRQELLRDPKGVFARELNIPIPEHITVQVVEESPTHVYLVLPQGPVSAGAELADAELEEFAGGYTRPTLDRRQLECRRQSTEWTEVNGDIGCLG